MGYTKGTKVIPEDYIGEVADLSLHLQTYLVNLVSLLIIKPYLHSMILNEYD